MMNAEESIVSCLESICDDHPARLIVIDGGSTDRSVEIAKRYANEVICNLTNSKLGAMRHLAVRLAQTRYLAFVDADVTLSPHALAQLRADLQDSRLAGVHCRILAQVRDSYWARAQDEHLRLRFNNSGVRRSIPTMAVMFDREVLAADNFNPTFSVLEDGELSHRLARKGYRFGISRAICYHRHRSTVTSFAKQRIWYGQGIWKMAQEHRSLFLPLRILAEGPLCIVWSIYVGRPVLLPYMLVHGFFFAFGLLGAVLEGVKVER